MQHEDIQLVAATLAGQAEYQADPKQFFNNLLRQAGLPQSWIRSRQGQWSGDIDGDANLLVRWAIGQGVNPERPEYTTLGCIFEVLLSKVGKEQAQALAIRIISYCLYRNEKLLADLAQRYSIPQLILGSDGEPKEGKTDFTWYGPTDEYELQCFLPTPQPELVDMRFMIRATERRESVCRIEIPGPQGVCYATGFLIAPNLVLTNHHVIAYPDPNNINANAQEATLRFNYIAGEDRKHEEGQLFRLDPGHPILEFSPTLLLDYALLKVEDSIKDADNVAIAPYELARPVQKTGLSILQHPNGDVMKLGFSENGITGVYEDINRIQYVTRTRVGSSGSPCFNDDWKVVALHHAQQNKGFGSIREGILFSAIHNEIKNYLT